MNELISGVNSLYDNFYVSRMTIKNDILLF